MQKAQKLIEQYHMIEPGDRVIAGISGGADSVCLLLVLCDLQKQVKFDLQVVHIEHGIRGQESLRDAAYVRTLCEKLQVEYACVSIDVPALAKERHLSLEEAGRIARYDTFEQMRAEWQANKIAVAHNRNDQAETVLWNLSRGSGIDGAAGIRPVRGCLIRPLLTTGREEIEAYLRERGIPWMEDGTNVSADYTRNVIRRQVLPLMIEKLNAKTLDHLAAFAAEQQEAAQYIEGETQKRCSQIAACEQGTAKIQIAGLKETPLFLRERILRSCLKEAGCSLKDLTRGHIEAVLGVADLQSGKSVMLPGGWTAVREFDRLVLKRRDDKTEGYDVPLCVPGETDAGGWHVTTRILKHENQTISQKQYTKWLNYDKISSDIRLRTRQTSDYLVVNRDGGTKKLKTYFTEEKIPVSQREQTGLIACGSEILWVIGHRISEAYKVDASTERILEIQVEAKETEL